MHKKISKILVIILFFGKMISFAAENSSIPNKDSVKVVATQDNSILRKAIALPLRYTVQPVIQAILYPTVPVVDYVFNENLIDRTIDLFSLNEEKTLMFFPTANFLLSNGSFIGFYFLYNDVLSQKNTRWVINYKKNLSLDWQLASDLSMNSIANSPFSLKYSYRQGANKNIGYTSPIEYSYDRHAETYVSYFRDDSTYSSTLSLDYALNPYHSLNISGAWHEYKFFTPLENRIVRDGNPTVEKLYERRLYDNYTQFKGSLAWSQNTKESRFSSTYGVYRGLGMEFANVVGGGDWVAYSGFLESYWLLGDKRYHLTRLEDKKMKKELRRFSLNKAISFLNPDELSEFLSQRKVIVSYLQFRQVQSVEADGMVPVSALNASGWSTPLRGYSGNDLYSEGMIAWSLEYRWPVIAKLDGFFFNEYAIPFKDFNTINGDQLRNSWGFGARVTSPDMFFIRTQLGFHGLNGMAFKISISPTYP